MRHVCEHCNKLPNSRFPLSTLFSGKSAKTRVLGKKHHGGFDLDYPGFSGKKHKHHKKRNREELYGTYARPLPPMQAVPLPVPIPYPSPQEPSPLPQAPVQPLPPIPNYPPATGKPKYIKNETVVTTNAQMTCADAFILDGNACVKYDKKPSKLGCKDGWGFRNGACVGAVVVPPSLDCDPGFEKNGAQCIKKKNAPKQILCPVGYILGRDSCERDVHTPPDIRCEEGFRFVGRECRKTQEAAPTAVCPPGYEDPAGLGQCRREIALPGKPSCPPDFQIVAGGCEKIFTAAAIPRCPERFRMDGLQCVFIATKPTIAQCSGINRNATLEGLTCVARHFRPPTMECPADFTMDPLGKQGFECSKECRVAAIPSCGKHKSKFDAHRKLCVGRKKNSPASFTCPAGYELIDKTSCFRIEKMPARPLCGLGFTLDHSAGSCVKREDFIPDQTCPEGFSLHGDRCEQRLSAPVEFVSFKVSAATVLLMPQLPIARDRLAKRIDFFSPRLENCVSSLTGTKGALNLPSTRRICLEC